MVHISLSISQTKIVSYFSYKMKYKLNVQGVCNSMGRFIGVDVNWPGGTHDAKVFVNSRIIKAVRKGKIPKMFRVLLPGRDEVPLLLLGDPAYPLLSHCMEEYSTCYSNENVMFNTMLRSARNQIEYAYGRLKARWQILTKAMNFINLEDIPQLIYACFVMHNYCELNNTALNEQGVQRFMDLEREIDQAGSRIYSTSAVGGTRTRSVSSDYLKEYIMLYFILNIVFDTSILITP